MLTFENCRSAEAYIFIRGISAEICASLNLATRDVSISTYFSMISITLCIFIVTMNRKLNKY